MGVADFSFPPMLPEISIEPSPERLDPIDCRELRWWFVVPEVGHSASSARYASRITASRSPTSPSSAAMSTTIAIDIPSRPTSG